MLPVLFGLKGHFPPQFVQEKTKAMWTGSAKNKYVGFQPYQVNLSYNQDRNISLIFYENLQTRDLTLYGRTMLGKSLGISKIVYAASMLSVPETFVKTVQDRIFNFLWKNKKKIK